MPLEDMPAVTCASPALSDGSRRLPASKSIWTSTIGMLGLSTRKTPAPLAWVQCWIGMAAIAWPPHSSSAAAALASAVRKMLLSRTMACKPLSVSHARQRRAGFAIGIDWLGPQGANRELVIAEVLGCDRLDLIGRYAAQPLDQALGRIQRQSLDPVTAEFARLVHDGIELVDLGR